MGRYIAFAEQLFSQFPQIHYTGIDVSAAMKIMAEKLLGDATGGHMRMSFVESFDKLDDSYWASVSEVPNLVVFNMSYFFSNVDSSFTENLANRMIAVMKRHPLNRYVFVIQHSEHDARLRSFTVFKRLLSQHVAHIKSARTTFRYESGGVSKNIPFVTKYGRQPACPVLFPTECSVQFLTECLSFPDFTMFVCHHIAHIENQRLICNNWVALGGALIVKPKSSIRLLCANMLFVICFSAYR